MKTSKILALVVGALVPIAALAVPPSKALNPGHRVAAVSSTAANGPRVRCAWMYRQFTAHKHAHYVKCSIERQGSAYCRRHCA